MEYIKEDGIIYKVTTTKKVVDLDSLKAELVDVKAEKEPTDEELIEMGISFHPYYNNNKELLEEKIAEIEEDVPTIEPIKK